VPPETPVSSLPALISVSGTMPPEQWNRVGTRLLPKMRTTGNVTAAVRLEVEVDAARSAAYSAELKQIIGELGLSESLRIVAAGS